MDIPNQKVIIFDDDEDILSICTYILEDQQWEVQTYVDTNNVIERVRDFQPALIFMDNWIPDEGGIVATQLLKNSADLMHIPVIYFSANSDIQSLALEARADAFLAKPFELEELEQVINKVLKSSQR